jgi:hypothetical protein
MSAYELLLFSCGLAEERHRQLVHFKLSSSLRKQLLAAKGSIERLMAMVANILAGDDYAVEIGRIHFNTSQQAAGSGPLHHRSLLT